MTDDDLAAMSSSELIDLYLDLNQRLTVLKQQAQVDYINGQQYVQLQAKVFHVMQELSKRKD
jgi:hypothetical protein